MRVDAEARMYEVKDEIGGTMRKIGGKKAERRNGDHAEDDLGAPVLLKFWGKAIQGSLELGL